MTTLNVTWTNPTPKPSQAPLAGVQVWLAVASATPLFSLIATVAAPGASFQQTSIDPGDYIVRLVVVDTQKNPLSSPPVDTPFNVPAPTLAAPDPVTNVAVSLS